MGDIKLAVFDKSVIGPKQQIPKKRTYLIVTYLRALSALLILLSTSTGKAYQCI